MENAKQVLSKEELDFLLSTGEGLDEDVDVDTEEGDDGSLLSAPADSGEANAPVCSRAEEAPGDTELLGTRARRFAALLGETIGRATGGHARVRLVAEESGTLAEVLASFGEPACLVELSAQPLARTAFFCLDDATAQGLADLCLGAGLIPDTRTRPLSLLDRELVARTLVRLPDSFARAFGLVSSTCERLAWQADTLVAADGESPVHAARFTLAASAHPGKALLVLPASAVRRARQSSAS